MKPKAVFMSNEEAINNAYSETVRRKMNNLLDFVPGYYTGESFRHPSGVSDLKDVEYVFSTWGMPSLTEAEIRSFLPKLKAVFYAAGSVQSFARPFLNLGIRVFSAWTANAVPVAEFTVSEILLATKGYYHRLHKGGCPSGGILSDCSFPGNFGAPVGIIGAGAVGSLVIEMLKNHNLDIYVYDPFMSDQKAAALKITKTDSLHDLFKNCFVISNHLANNPQTENIIDGKCFALMGKNAVFINTGRGMQVNEEDLISAMKAEPSRIALLDVTRTEPPEQGSELYALPNIFLTPHIAGSIGCEVQRMGEYMLEEFEKTISGKETKYGVTLKMLETMA